MAQARSFPEHFDFRLIAAGLALVLIGLFAPHAQAQQAATGWSVCNQTSMIIETSTGRPSGSDVIIEGWTRIRPGECRVVLAAPLQPGPHFLYGRSSRAHRGGIREWSGEYEHCVDAQGSFSVENPPNCVEMGLEGRKFKPVLIESKTRWTTTLKETQKWSMKTAKAAGIQRLLDDAGVESGKMDGYIGRRTRSAISDFLTSKKLPADTDDNQLMDYLEQVAIERSRNLGLTICNRSGDRVWTAIGRRRGEGWESRGWWPIEAGACERVIDEALLAAPHYIFAEIETPSGVKRLKNAAETFCMTRSQFAILGRDKCTEKYYQTGLFVETDDAKDGKLVFELFNRDFEYPKADSTTGGGE